MNASRTSCFIAVCVLIVFGSLSPAVAAEAATDDPNDPNEMRAKVVSVRGIAKKMQANQEEPKWTPLKADETLGQYAVVRTGFNSQVVLHFADRGQVTIDSGTKVGISQFAAIQGTAGNIRANLGLKYGSMRLKVDRSRGASDFSVSTAVATLSVRGTDGWMAFFADLGVALRGAEGTWAVIKGIKSRAVSGNQRTNNALDRSDKIKTLERNGQLSDLTGGSTADETLNLAYNRDGRSLLGGTGNPNSSTSTPATTTRSDNTHNNGDPHSIGF